MKNPSDKIKLKEEPNYLITSFIFKDNNEIWKINKEGLYSGGGGPEFTLDEMLNDYISVRDNEVEIYSVKNSKGEEWVIGDKYSTDGTNIGEIKNFKIINNIMCVFQVERKGFLELEWLKKPKTVIYTTTNGVDIKEDSCLVLYLVNKELNTLYTVGINSFSKEDAEVASR